MGAVSSTFAPGRRSDRCALIAGTFSLILRALQSAAIDHAKPTRPSVGELQGLP
jgi:hypothetical protein